MTQNRVSETVSRLATKDSKREAVLLLRYHMSQDRIEDSLKALRLAKPSPVTKVYASYAEIARLCKMPYSTVRNHCLSVIGQSKSAIAKHGSAYRR